MWVTRACLLLWAASIAPRCGIRGSRICPQAAERQPIGPQVRLGGAPEVIAAPRWRPSSQTLRSLLMFESDEIRLLFFLIIFFFLSVFGFALYLQEKGQYTIKWVFILRDRIASKFQKATVLCYADYWQCKTAFERTEENFSPPAYPRCKEERMVFCSSGMCIYYCFRSLLRTTHTSSTIVLASFCTVSEYAVSNCRSWIAWQIFASIESDGCPWNPNTMRKKIPENNLYQDLLESTIPNTRIAGQVSVNLLRWRDLRCQRSNGW